MTDVERPRVLSFGGGVQSSALVALLGRGEYPGAAPQEVWFCDPKNERPQTYEWIEAVIKPYLARLGVPFLVLERHQSYYRTGPRKGQPSRGPDLLKAHRDRGEYPLRRNRDCTIDWKVRVMLDECKRRGWDKTCGVEKHIGISLDELHRARVGMEDEWERKRYPLVEARLFRDDCARICQETFGANPIKSGCWFCKYQRPSQWREVWEQRADGRWAQAVQWEKEVMAARSRARVFIDTNPQRTLEEWAAMWERGEQLPMFTEQAGACDGGYCMV